MRGESEAGEPGARYPIRGTFFGCCASANVPAARRRSVSGQTIFLFMAFYLPAQRLCHKTRSLKIRTYGRRRARERLILATGGVANLIHSRREGASTLAVSS